MSLGRSPLVIAALLGVACTGKPAKTPEDGDRLVGKNVSKDELRPEAPPSAPKEAPPPSGPVRPWAVPKSTWGELGNGLALASRRESSLPIVHLRIAVAAGSAGDGEKTGLAAVCARAIGASGAGAMDPQKARAAFEDLGATLEIDVNADRVVYGISTTSPHFEEALGLLATVVTSPRLGEQEVASVRRALAEEATQEAKSDGFFGAMMVLHQDLFPLPSEHHPYASYAANDEEIGKIKASDCKDYHRRNFVPKNMFLAASGDVRAEDLRKAAEKHLGRLRGGAAPTISLTDPMPPEATKITLVDRPGEKRSEVVVGSLAPAGDDASYGAFLTAAWILGGPHTGRMHESLAEQKRIATGVVSSVLRFASGPSIFYTYARTTDQSTGETLAALLDGTERLATETPSEAEIERAASAFAGAYAVASSMPGHPADELCDLWLQKRYDEAPFEILRATRECTPIAATKIFAEHVRKDHLVIVVSGDAATLGPLLQPFGEIKVVDPVRHFSRSRTLPAVSAR